SVRKGGIRDLAERVLLETYMPASVLINADFDVLYVHGHTGKYLEPASGEASLNLLRMAREGLHMALAAAVRKAIAQQATVRYEGLRVKSNPSTEAFGSGEASIVNLIVQPVTKPDAAPGLLMVIFEDVTSIAGREQPAAGEPDGEKEPRIVALQRELRAKEEHLQAAIEELQTANEELTSTNEELQSANEELQSTNEELTTSKEEMQSLNEELQTVNIELQSKVDDYTLVNNDMINLLNSTDIAILFLDRELHIRRFTKQTTKIFKLIQSDIGRSFTDQVSDLKYPEILNDVKEVLRTLILVEKDVATNDGRWFSVRIIPYRTVDDRIDGLVITFSDITKAKKLETELNKTIAILSSHNLDGHEKQ
ncbi:MAG: PAS domain-containing protein, partial [Bacteroidota bacterium]|nr:PAS domain-containing protein [Bacteroidota bacterium]